mmetsp:Transcript_27469/g.76255  ORF Transcript_27469/g.76255 Transcript_27469/m.76255 type:complete len:273 (+) Transcript_27469:99-917(+)
MQTANAEREHALRWRRSGHRGGHRNRGQCDRGLRNADAYIGLVGAVGNAATAGSGNASPTMPSDEAATSSVLADLDLDGVPGDMAPPPDATMGPIAAGCGDFAVLPLDVACCGLSGSRLLACTSHTTLSTAAGGGGDARACSATSAPSCDCISSTLPSSGTGGVRVFPPSSKLIGAGTPLPHRVRWNMAATNEGEAGDGASGTLDAAFCSDTAGVGGIGEKGVGFSASSRSAASRGTALDSCAIIFERNSWSSASRSASTCVSSYLCVSHSW